MVEPIRLLIADDSDAVRHAICTLLKDEPGIAITGEARDYRELVRMLSESTPEVVLMDVHMPDEHRFDVALVKAQLRGSCLVAMSIFADEETADLAQSYGAFRLLDKMNLASTLIPTIEECIQQNGRAHHA